MGNCKEDTILTHLLGSLLVRQLMFVPGVMALVLIGGGHGHPPGLVHGLGCGGRSSNSTPGCGGTRAVPPSPTHQHHGTPACMTRSGPTADTVLPKTSYPGTCQALTAGVHTTIQKTPRNPRGLDFVVLPAWSEPLQLLIKSQQCSFIHAMIHCFQLGLISLLCGPFFSLTGSIC